VSPAFSEPRFLTAAGEPCAAAEWTELLLEIPVDPQDWVSVFVAVNGREQAVQLRRFAGAPRPVIAWPRSGAGRYRVEIRKPDAAPQRHRLDIPPAKLDGDGLAILLDDLDRRLPHALAVALQRAGALAGLSIRPPEAVTPEAEAARLRRIVEGEPGGAPGLLAVLAAIAADPHRILQSVETFVPLDRLRRPEPVALRRALYTAHDVDDEGRPLRAPDRRIEPSVDVPENRIVRALVELVRRRLAALDRGGRFAVEDLRGAVDLARRRAPFLDAVGPLAAPPSKPTLVMVRHPFYRRALALWRDLTQGLAVTLDEPKVDAPFRDVPSLYEVWATLVTLEAAVAAATAAGFRVVKQTLVRRHPGDLTVSVLPDSRLVAMADDTGRRFEVQAQPSFGPTTEPLCSASFTQRPDIALVLVEPDGRRRLVLLDPKYKLDGEVATGADADAAPSPTGGPMKTDIDKMHAYRDAIVAARTGTRVVEHAAILYPGPTRRFAGDVSAITARPGEADETARGVSDLVAGLLAS